MEILIYIANGMYLASYIMKNMLYLRILTVAAACCLIGYFYNRPEPEMTVVGWNLFFVALNVVQISRIIWPRLLKFTELICCSRRRMRKAGCYAEEC